MNHPETRPWCAFKESLMSQIIQFRYVSSASRALFNRKWFPQPKVALRASSATRRADS